MSRPWYTKRTARRRDRKAARRGQSNRLWEPRKLAVESLEERRLLALVSGVPDVAFDLSMEPTGANSVVVRRVVDLFAPSDELEVVVNGATFSFDFSQVDSITVDGSADDDTLTVDFSLADPVPAGGLDFDGVSGVIDQLIVIGDDMSAATSRPSAQQSGAGSILVGSNSEIRYERLTPITISHMQNLTLVTGGSSDDILVEGVSPQVTQISGTSDNVPFETHTLFNVGRLVIDSRTNDTGGNDVIALNAAITDGMIGGFDEFEPNDLPFGAVALPNFAFGDGGITPAGDVDYWSGFVNAVGDLVFAYVDTQENVNNGDAVVQILGMDQTTVLGQDSGSGPSGGAVVAGVTNPNAMSISNDVFYRINELNDDNTIPSYTLYQASISPGESANEVEGNDSMATANPIQAAMTTGRLTSGDEDYFSIFAPAGSRLVAIMDNDPDRDGNFTHTQLEILAPDGTSLATGNNLAGNAANAVGAVTAPVSGRYTIRVADGGGGSDQSYRFVTQVLDDVRGDLVPIRSLDTFTGGGIDTFLVRPSLLGEFQEPEIVNINGDDPAGSLGDVLAVDLRGITGVQLPQQQSPDGTILSETHHRINFTSIEQLIVTDDLEGNDVRSRATVLGSLPKVTLHASIDTANDVDYFNYTAAETGKLVINAKFVTTDLNGDSMNDRGDLDLFVEDARGNVIASAMSLTDDETLVIPVVSQESYFIRVEGGAGDGVAPQVNNYGLEIENFAAPNPTHVLLDPASDTGFSQNDQITTQTNPRFFIRADLTDFSTDISILTAAQAAAGASNGAAVQVFLENTADGTSLSGYASPVGSSTTLFSFMPDADPGNPPDTTLSDGLYLVSSAVRMFDGQRDDMNMPDPQDGRSPLSPPLLLSIDTTEPSASVPDLQASSDTGLLDDDNVTNQMRPTFQGTAEAGSIVRLLANGLVVGQTTAAADGRWQVTAAPLADGQYEIRAEVEDAAGNTSTTDAMDPALVIDTTQPNTPLLDLEDESDTGRSRFDNITALNQLAFTMVGNDTVNGNGNAVPHDIQYRLYWRPGIEMGAAAGEVLVYDSAMEFAGLTELGLLSRTVTTELNNAAGTGFPDGAQNFKLEIEDRAGNISEDFLLGVLIDSDTEANAPAKSFGQPDVAGDGLHPDSDSGVPGAPNLTADRITSDTTPTFWGRSEADALIQAYVEDADGNLVFIGQTQAVPLDGETGEDPAGEDGFWQLTSVVDMNSPSLGFATIDGHRRIFITATDAAGNSIPIDQMNPGDMPEMFLDIFIDTQGPRITSITANDAASDYELFGGKSAENGLQPTPAVHSLVIQVSDLPLRLDPPNFLYDALHQPVAVDPGHYQLVGDRNGIVPIHGVQFETTPDLATGQEAQGRITLYFGKPGADGMFGTADDIPHPLPDDRYTLTISDALVDPAGNALDGESRSSQPLGEPDLPTGDGVSGGQFAARFTVDTRAEIGAWAAGSVYIDTNGNFLLDPVGVDGDATNEDIVYVLGYTSDNLFAGNFATVGGDADGFDKIAAYGRFGGNYRWLIDTDNDGVPNFSLQDALGIDGLPIAGDFDPNTPGDEVAIKDGTTWYLDTNANLIIDSGDTILVGDMVGRPIIGDFDGDGLDDLAAWSDNRFSLDLSRDGLNGFEDIGFDFGFAGVRERPFAADFDGDGFDDLGLWVPDRSGATPAETAEWYILVSGNSPLIERITTSLDTGRPTINFTPHPFGPDIYAQFSDDFAVPIVGNFDPPVAALPLNSSLRPLTDTNMDEPLDVNGDGRITPLDALLVINALNGDPSPQGVAAFRDAVYLDVNADASVTALDALVAVNYLNERSLPAAGGEGEISSSSIESREQLEGAALLLNVAAWQTDAVTDRPAAAQVPVPSAPALSTPGTPPKNAIGAVSLAAVRSQSLLIASRINRADAFLFDEILVDEILVDEILDSEAFADFINAVDAQWKQFG